MTIDPTMANNSIIDVIINHIDKLVYITFPILIISYMSTKLLSQLLDDTWYISLNISESLEYISLKFKESAVFVSGNILLYGIKNPNIVKIAKGILLLVSLISSDTLIFINIKINKNKIDTAPTYTKR